MLPECVPERQEAELLERCVCGQRIKVRRTLDEITGFIQTE